MKENLIGAVKIVGILHIVKNRNMHGYKTECGKSASFGHTLYRVNLGDVGCFKCAKSQGLTKPEFEALLAQQK